MRFAASLLLLVCALPLQAEEQVLNIYNWADYVAPEALKRFQGETGIRVKYDTFDSSEVLDSKLLTGGSGYDVVFPASSGLARAIQAKAVQPVGALANAGNLDPELLAKLASVDPGNQFGVPYTWGTVGLGVNRQAVEQRLPGVPLNSLDLLFKPEYAGKLKDCGIAVLDSPQEVIAIALNYLGKAPYSNAAEDLAAVQQLLGQLQPNLRYVGTGRHI
ncbi:extracellular solute-binding protein, partial [Pseudomonas sp. CrR25]|nr:extracellular solute-binding protein [Pseudomonas sp. CrR25]